MAGPYTIPDAVYDGTTPDPVEWANDYVKPTLLDMYAERSGGEFFEGTSTVQPTLATSSFETYPINSTTTLIGLGSFNTSNYIYTIGKTGLFDCQATVRTTDDAAARSFGVGIGVTNADGPHFLWGNLGGTQRSARQYRRVARFTAGDLVRLYIWSGLAYDVSAGSLVIMRVGE